MPEVYFPRSDGVGCVGTRNPRPAALLGRTEHHAHSEGLSTMLTPRD